MEGGVKDADDAWVYERMQSLPIPAPSHLHNSELGRIERPSGGRMMSTREETSRVFCE